MIDPTLDATRSHETAWDVIVVGAGIAGATAAGLLARAGLRTLLVDRARFPRGKVCGCCLNRRTLDLFDRIGYGPLLESLHGVPLTGVRWGSFGRTAHIVLPAGVSVSREALDAALIQHAIRAGADFLPETVATLGPVEHGRREVLLGTISASAKVVLSADGLNGRTAAKADGFDVPAVANARIGAGTTIADGSTLYPAGLIHMACGAGGYVGLVRLEDGRLDVAGAFDVPVPSLPERAIDLLRQAGWPIPAALATAAWRGTPALTRRPAHIAGERWFALGDAAGYVEPFTGEGMGWAAATAASIVPFVRRGCVEWEKSLADGWETTYHRQLRPAQRLCRSAAWLLRSPLRTRWAVRLTAAIPPVARPIVHLLNRPFGRREGFA